MHESFGKFFTMITSAVPRQNGVTTRTGIALGLFGALSLFVVIGLISCLNTRTLSQEAESVTHTHEVLSALDDILSLAKDAETGQRGYVITGDEQYLKPYHEAAERIYERIDELARLTGDSGEQQQRIPVLQSRVDAKFNELKESIELRREEGFDAAQKLVLSDAGKNAMEAIRLQVTTMEQAER